MESIQTYASNPLHNLVGHLGVLMGIPDSCVTRVECVDCGKMDIAANFYWTVNLEKHKRSGPHCGCCKV